MCVVSGQYVCCECPVCVLGVPSMCVVSAYNGE